ncbi:MAG: cytochrome C oxidase subunit IV family protein [Candidatus Microthrix subdominans]|uniref:Cytochrome C oxidase subunit IV family protein n=1 Tax=Candidatus Neomicrothrix subdominans TaxID=2954438 RepID=A0A936TBQ5_9ACTN|nr:cytochrome C oxidase subunit IV family protein [Candidatus Microthrix sp.]MBK9295363.1 cytochrome C oxidase subunit IV family protein [Candidatus Microthrix subdominans]MBK6311468.1 cytochrome C oxidase subunit IV family protein [Candidatus Microthrix sp.]MBK6438150.1 cytochrome C oxidase subunit IV family protein [Candidatus Microthrix sp.]MBK6439733.1 cytochrome C oxidase subunit IV family protein [Candidatus Microthrix sp.]MBK6970958.1 cytochrome C oxidase subunit IV family protein [Cand
MSTSSPDEGTETLPSSPFSEHDTLTAEEAANLRADEGLNRMVHHSDMIYIKVGAVLAVLTAIEIALPELLNNGKIYGPLLIALMIIKFVMVAGFFMHLRYDGKELSGLFYGGAILAVIVYVAVLSTFSFWTDSGNQNFTSPPPIQTTVPLEDPAAPGG